MTVDEKYMSRCFELARRGTKSIKLNPAVGSVIVHQGRIIGEGYHMKSGSHHAEVNAINSVKPSDRILLKESTIYVSLEPCNHTGKTPPCTQAILTAEIPKVVISCLDPNPLMQGKSQQKLISAGIIVETGVLESEGKNVIKSYIVTSTGRPYVIFKFAQSIEGYIGSGEKQVFLSNEYSKVLVHKWRSKVDGILIGVNTANIDNPTLTTREYPGESPLRIIIDPTLRINKNLKLLQDGLSYQIITSVDQSDLNCWVIPPSQFTVDHILKLLYDKGIYRLLIEGGAYTIQSFIDANIWDEARIINSNTRLQAGTKAPVVKGYKVKVQKLDSDVITYIENRNVII